MRSLRVPLLAAGAVVFLNMVLVATAMATAAADRDKKPETVRPHTVSIEFDSGLSVDEKSAVLDKIAKQMKGTKHVSESLNPKANYRWLRIPQGMSVKKAIEALDAVEGVAKAAAIEIKPGTYDPGTVLVSFDKDTKPEKRREIVASLNGATVKQEFKIIPTIHVKLPKGTSVFDAMRAYTYQPGVKFVEVNGIVSINASSD